ncbi:DUF4179 domain-containing protein [Paenibacillus arenilitoris]|uniref:DUF4179 domain-containing protein n=1 Tax=Paenibacillus arenilitoris TaxID=2772299 RepID=A0A927CU24_9BACL|nr:DUF4179 domain-containing protein [Paenibacillus arenilitoris]MBD2871871.1 DUF4179 domain-containing protein [Paenibacillus arenilitoris]
MYLANSQNDEIEAHILHCNECKDLLNKTRRELDYFNDLLYSSELPDQANYKIMSEISKIEKNQKGEYGLKPSRPRKKYYIAASIVAFLLIACSSPVMAKYVQSLFMDSDVMDQGLLTAYEVGNVFHADIAIEDRGFTLKVSDIIADPARVAAAVQIIGKDGEHFDNILNLNGSNHIEVVGENEEVLAEFSDIGYAPDFYYMQSIMKNELEHDQVYIRGVINRLTTDKGEVIDGDWSFKIPVNLKAVSKNVEVNNLNKTYTFKGIALEVMRMVYSPAGVRLEINTSELGDGSNSNATKPEHELYFHIEDINGKIVEKVTTMEVGYPSSLFSKTVTYNQTSRKYQWTYLFRSLQREESLYFVLDGLRKTEQSKDMMKFNPSDLQKNIKTFESNGDIIKLGGVKQEANKTIIQIGGQFVNPFINDEWQLIDDNNKSYKLSFSGSYMEENTITLNEDSEFIAEGTPFISGNWLLKRVKVDTIHRPDQSWRFRID